LNDAFCYNEAFLKGLDEFVSYAWEGICQIEK